MNASDPPDSQDVDLYVEILAAVRTRLDEVTRLRDEPPSIFTVNVMAMHLRMILESVAMGSLVTNRPSIEAIASAFAKKRLDDVVKLARRVNPDYWPQAGILVAHQHGHSVVFYDDHAGVVTEGDWQRHHGFVSGWLHAPNPYRLRPSDERHRVKDGHAAMEDLHNRLTATMQAHHIRLAGSHFIHSVELRTEDGGMRISTLRRPEGFPAAGGKSTTPDG